MTGCISLFCSPGLWLYPKSRSVWGSLAYLVGETISSPLPPLPRSLLTPRLRGISHNQSVASNRRVQVNKDILDSNTGFSFVLSEEKYLQRYSTFDKHFMSLTGSR